MVFTWRLFSRPNRWHVLTDVSVFAFAGSRQAARWLGRDHAGQRRRCRPVVVGVSSSTASSRIVHAAGALAKRTDQLHHRRAEEDVPLDQYFRPNHCGWASNALHRGCGRPRLSPLVGSDRIRSSITVTVPADQTIVRTLPFHGHWHNRATVFLCADTLRPVRC